VNIQELYLGKGICHVCAYLVTVQFIVLI